MTLKTLITSAATIVFTAAMTPEPAVSIILRFTDSPRAIVDKQLKSGLAEDALHRSLSLPAVDSMLERLGVTGVSFWRGLSGRGELTAWPTGTVKKRKAIETPLQLCALLPPS